MSTDIKEKKVKVDSEVGGEEKKVKKDKKEKKRKEREEGDNEAVAVPAAGNEDGPVVEIAEETKEERKARKRAKKEAKAAAEADPAPSATAEIKEETKEERKARRKAEKLAKELADPSTSTSKTEEVPAPPAATIPDDEVALKKKSKQERKEAGASKWTQQASEANQAMQARAEKSPIYQDETLSDMAKKGLYYCELHAASQVQLQDPEYRWKFNKARQGWLMRNVWNDTEISEIYFDRVVAYLKTLPGSARKGMIEIAKKHATAVAKAPKVDETEAQPETEAEEEKAEPVVTEEGEEKEAGSGGEVAVEMRRDRAQRILKALGAR